MADVVIVYSENGHEALRELARSDVDLVLTDLNMPGMTGLELVEEMHALGCKVPVILMTGFGNEGIAAQALLAGASSYVPKRALQKYLIETVNNVLAFSQTDRPTASKPAGLSELQSHFILDNDIAKATAVVEYLVAQLRFLGTYGDSQSTHVGIALQEALSNAIYHGNLELSSELRQHEDGRYLELAETRRKLAPFKARRVLVHATVGQDAARYVIGDEGPGFDVARTRTPAPNTENFDLVSGRGLLLIASFMDEVSHNATGNEIVMVKRSRAEPSQSAAIGGGGSLVAPSPN
jgi:CheY-like chemotaxis protein